VSVVEGKDGTDDARVLRKIMEKLREEYAHAKTLPALLAAAPQLVYTLMAPIDQARQSGIEVA